LDSMSESSEIEIEVEVDPGNTTVVCEQAFGSQSSSEKEQDSIAHSGAEGMVVVVSTKWNTYWLGQLGSSVLA